MQNIALSMIEHADNALKALTSDLFNKKQIDIIDIQYMRDSSSFLEDGVSKINTAVGSLAYLLLIERKNGGSALDIATQDISVLNSLINKHENGFASLDDFYKAISFGDVQKFEERIKTGAPVIPILYYPEINEYNGIRSIQVVVTDYT